MAEVITPEQVMERGRQWQRVVLETVTPEQLRAALDPEVLLAALEPEQRLAGLGPEQLLSIMSEAERLLRRLRADADLHGRG